MSAKDHSSQPSPGTRPPLCFQRWDIFFGDWETYSSHSLPWTALSSSAVILWPVVK